MTSNLSSENILRDAHDVANKSIRTTAEAIILGNVDVELTLTPDDDAVALGNRSNTRFAEITASNELSVSDAAALARLISIDNKVATAANQTSTIAALSSVESAIETAQDRRLLDGVGNPITSQSSGSQRALDVGVTVGGAQIDPRQIRSLTAADTVTVVQPTGSNLRVQVDSSVLPTGAATSALQTSGNVSLASIDADIDVALSSRASETTLSTLNGKVPSGLTVSSTRLLVDNTGLTQPISAVALPLPVGAATEVTLSNINSKLNTLGQKASADSVPVVISSDQSTINTNITDSNTRELGRVLASDLLIATETFNTTSSTLAQARPVNGDIEVRRYKSKTIFIQNTSLNDGRYSIFASVDNGATFDIPVVNNVALNDGVIAVTTLENAYTHLRITARSQTNGQATSFVTKAYAQGV